MLTQSIKSALASGQFSHVPVIIGTNHDEYRLFVAVVQLISAAGNRGELPGHDRLHARRTPRAQRTRSPRSTRSAVISSPAIALGAVGTDAIFACPALTAEESLSRYVPVYAYEFNDENAPELFLPPVGFPYGAAHASELQYVFDQSAVPYPARLSVAQQQLAVAMKQYWTNLAKAGVPGRRVAAVQPHQPAGALPGRSAAAA